MQTVMQGTTPCPGCPAAISNPNPVEVKLSDGSYKVLLAYDTMNNPKPEAHGEDMQVWSADDGLTWHNASQVAYPPVANTGALIGPSVGIQSANGTIFFSAVFESSKWLYWSTDYGVTWQSSKVLTGSGLTECSIAFLNDTNDGNVWTCMAHFHACCRFVKTFLDTRIVKKLR